MLAMPPLYTSRRTGWVLRTGGWDSSRIVHLPRFLGPDGRRRLFTHTRIFPIRIRRPRTSTYSSSTLVLTLVLTLGVFVPNRAPFLVLHRSLATEHRHAHVLRLGTRLAHAGLAGSGPYRRRALVWVLALAYSCHPRTDSRRRRDPPVAPRRRRRAACRSSASPGRSARPTYQPPSPPRTYERTDPQRL